MLFSSASGTRGGTTQAVTGDSAQRASPQEAQMRVAEQQRRIHAARDDNGGGGGEKLAEWAAVVNQHLSGTRAQALQPPNTPVHPWQCQAPAEAPAQRRGESVARTGAARSTAGDYRAATTHRAD